MDILVSIHETWSLAALGLPGRLSSWNGDRAWPVMPELVTLWPFPESLLAVAVLGAHCHQDQPPRVSQWLVSNMGSAVFQLSRGLGSSTGPSPQYGKQLP